MAVHGSPAGGGGPRLPRRAARARGGLRCRLDRDAAGFDMAARARPLIFVVNQRGGRLLRATLAPNGRQRLDLVDVVETDWKEQAHERGRPSPRRGRQGNSYASAGHEPETFVHRYAKEVAAWIEQKLGKDRAMLFAPPRFLGELREVLPARLSARIDEHEGDLGYMSPADLARHPLVAAVLDSHPRD